MKHCNNTCDMYDADNSVCCAADEPYVSVELDAECFFDAHDRDHPHKEPPVTNAQYIRSMTDEGLADILVDASYYQESAQSRPEWAVNGEIYMSRQQAVDAALHWLRQPKETQA